MAFDKNGQGYFTFEEVVEHKVVQAMSKKFHANYQEQAVKTFYKVYSRHLSTMDQQAKLCYGLDDIKKIDWDNKQQCFKVYFANDWFHYTSSGEWY